MQNPYQSTEPPRVDTTDEKVADRHWVAALPCLLPVITMSLVILVVILERDFGVRGARLHDYSSAMGWLFNVSVYFLFGAWFWAPIGLLISILLSLMNTSGNGRLLHPVFYVVCCVMAIVLVNVDPDGVFTYYFD